jgi:hypothetical protein
VERGRAFSPLLPHTDEVAVEVGGADEVAVEVRVAWCVVRTYVCGFLLVFGCLEWMSEFNLNMRLK